MLDLYIYQGIKVHLKHLIENHEESWAEIAPKLTLGPLVVQTMNEFSWLRVAFDAKLPSGITSLKLKEIR